MATQTIVTTLDDLDGSEASETLRFALDGADYEIDLNDVHATKLRQALAGYVGAARKLGRSSGPRARHYQHVPTAPDATTVREWARNHGIEVSGKGRISSHVLDQYRAAERSGFSPAESTESAQNDEPVVQVGKAVFVEPAATSGASTPEKPTRAPRKRAPRKVVATADNLR